METASSPSTSMPLITPQLHIANVRYPIDCSPEQLINFCESFSNNIVAASPSSNPYPDVKAQKAFEKGLLEKTAKQTADIILYDNRVVLYKCESDIMMYVVGGMEENEIMLYNVVLALRDSLHLLFKYESSLQHSYIPS
jgi:hypothetical protein